VTEPVHPTLTAQRVVVEMAQEYEAAAAGAERRALESGNHVEASSYRNAAFVAREIADALRRAERRILLATGAPTDPSQADTVSIRPFIERAPTRLDLERPPPA
jgi:hypothetical protein